MSTRFRLSLVTLTLTTFVAGALTSCAARSLSTEAESLADELRDSPGVSQVELTYTKPITLDSGKLDLEVTMDESAPADEIVAVVTQTYAAFSGTHDAEEGDLDVAVGEHLVHLRSFSSRATTEAVTEAAQRGVGVLSDLRSDGPERSVRVDLTTQDVEKAPHVATDISVALESSGGDVVLEEVTALQRTYPSFGDIGWRVSSGGRPDLSGRATWELGNTESFPSPAARKLYVALSADLPRGSAVTLIDDLSRVALPRAAGNRVVEVSERHLSLLGGHAEAYYDLELDGTQVLSVMNGECWFDTGKIGASLEAAHADRCTTIIAQE